MSKSPSTTRDKPFNLNGTLTKRLHTGLEQGLFKGANLRFAHAILSDPQRAAWGSATEMAREAGSSDGPLSVFKKRLGYTDHESFQQAARDELAGSSDAEKNDDVEKLNARFAVLDNDARNVTHPFVEGQKGGGYAEQVENFARAMESAKRIFVVSGTLSAADWSRQVADFYRKALPTVPVQWIGPETLAQIEAGLINLPSFKTGDRLVVLHLGDKGFTGMASPFSWAYSEDSVVWAAHLMIASRRMTGSYEHRVMHVHDGKDSFAAFRAVMEICAILVQDKIREIKAR
jgi:hypothetical protein